jgi:hypothetical protein
MKMTESGIAIDVREEQPSNASYAMFDTESGIVIVVRESQS